MAETYLQNKTLKDIINRINFESRRISNDNVEVCTSLAEDLRNFLRLERINLPIISYVEPIPGYRFPKETSEEISWRQPFSKGYRKFRLDAYDGINKLEDFVEKYVEKYGAHEFLHTLKWNAEDIRKNPKIYQSIYL